MLLNRFEYALMNNPLRELIQRRFEAVRLLRMGGPMGGGRALEIGCGRGAGTRLIRELFGASSVDAFDADPRMVAQARLRLRSMATRIRLWVGDAASIAVRDSSYDAVFDFGIIHHVEDWRRALAEVQRVLKPGGRFYAEEVLSDFIVHPITRRLLEHPEFDRFNSTAFVQGMRAAGLVCLASCELARSFAWFIGEKPAVRNP
jgi:ubiquinone/menaquinone biosynthesis C-methylase UbiE